jgi:hypothetical protein
MNEIVVTYTARQLTLTFGGAERIEHEVESNPCSELLGEWKHSLFLHWTTVNGN